MSVTILESGLHFGEFEETNLFQTEKSSIYKSLGESIKSVEFILMHKDNSIIFIEAKSGSPQPYNQVDFDKFIDEIYCKFSHSIDLFFSIILKRLNDIESEIPNCFKEAEYSTVKIKLILIINGHEILWLAPISDALTRKLKMQIKTWRLDLKVMNHKLADEYGLLKH